jgi:hypothetical protein
MWGGCVTTIRKSVVNGNTFEEVFAYRMGKCMKEELDIFTVITLKIWFRQNTVMHWGRGGGKFIHPNQLITEAALTLKYFIDVNALERLPPLITEVLATESWKAPPPGMYKINWDVAIDSKNRCMGIGIIAQDCEG